MQSAKSIMMLQHLRAATLSSSSTAALSAAVASSPAASSRLLQQKPVAPSLSSSFHSFPSFSSSSASFVAPVSSSSSSSSRNSSSGWCVSRRGFSVKPNDPTTGSKEPGSSRRGKKNTGPSTSEAIVHAERENAHIDHPKPTPTATAQGNDQVGASSNSMPSTLLGATDDNHVSSSIQPQYSSIPGIHHPESLDLKGIAELERNARNSGKYENTADVTVNMAKNMQPENNMMDPRDIAEKRAAEGCRQHEVEKQKQPQTKDVVDDAEETPIIMGSFANPPHQTAPTAGPYSQTATSAATPMPVDSDQSSSSSSSSPSSSDVIEIIKNEHRIVEKLYNEFKTSTDNPEKQKKLVHQIIHELSVHAACEEMVLYPAVEKYVKQPLGHKLATHSLGEHEELKQILFRLDSMDVITDSVGVTATLDEAMQDVKHHVEEEENNLLPALAAAVPSDELAKLGKSFMKHKSIAPTRPHPSAPDKYPFNVAVNAATKPLDALRDMVSNRDTKPEVSPQQNNSATNVNTNATNTSTYNNNQKH